MCQQKQNMYLNTVNYPNESVVSLLLTHRKIAVLPAAGSTVSRDMSLQEAPTEEWQSPVEENRQVLQANSA